ncbi:MAG: polysaccharide biosynthesis/export family protein [Rhodobacteraceae bacterium]|nr:polysaccharide biosynthesis/export family protein [Paracoccaceae bacterium]
MGRTSGQSGAGRSKSKASGWKMALIGVLGGVVLSGCSTFLPSAGPSTGDILDGDPNQTLDYAIVELDAVSVEASRLPPKQPFTLDFRGVGIQSTGTVGVGDVLNVSVWENVEDGLFTGIGGKQAVIPEVLVDEAGFITLPYVGKVKAAGRKMVDIQDAVRDSLEDQTLKPQIIVSRVQSNSRAVSVQGAVGAPGLYQLVLHQDRLVPVLAAAGGARGKMETTKVTVRRGDASSDGWLDDIFSEPSANIALRSGDIVLVDAQDHFFNAFGAVNRSGRQPLTRRNITLLDGISQIGGLDGQSANPTGVFIFRNEPAEIAAGLQPLNAEELAEAGALTRFGDNHKVVYQLQLTRPEALFLAGEFKLRDGDTIYVTEAPYTAWRKVLSVIIPAIGTAGSVTSLTNTLTD